MSSTAPVPPRVGVGTLKFPLAYCEFLDAAPFINITTLHHPSRIGPSKRASGSYPWKYRHQSAVEALRGACQGFVAPTWGEGPSGNKYISASPCAATFVPTQWIQHHTPPTYTTSP